MVEGGLLLWKRQKVKQKGPIVDYSCLKLPLPVPPKGTKWQHNKETKEWKVVAVENATINTRNDDTDHQSNLNKKNHHDNKHEREDVYRSTTSTNDNNDDDTTTTSTSHKKVKNVDYCCHVVLETDTFVGICLAYKISATLLRQVNMFSGSNLRLAPARLYVPLNRDKVLAGQIRLQDETSLEYKTSVFLAELPTLRRTEAKFYLEVNDMKLEDAIRHAREDLTWEKTRQAQELRRNCFNDTSTEEEDTSTTTKNNDNNIIVHRHHKHASNTILTADRAIPVVNDRTQDYDEDDEYAADLELIPLVKNS